MRRIFGVLILVFVLLVLVPGGAEELTDVYTVTDTIIPETIQPKELYSDASEAVQYVRYAIKQITPFVSIHVTADVYEELSPELEDVFAHTGAEDEGDYLKSLCGISEINGKRNPDGTYTVNYGFGYYLSYEEEMQVADAVASIAEDIGLNDPELTEYEKIHAIFDWVAENVKYDYDTAPNGVEVHPQKFTAFSAAVEKNSVCQGISALVYRLCLHAGIDSRQISSKEMDHSWNIVRYGDRYYLCDATWNIDQQTDQYFMCGTANFGHHNEDDEFSDACFSAAYPVSELPLSLGLEGADTDIFGYLKTGCYQDLDGNLFYLKPDGRNKVLVFFTPDCPFSGILLGSLAGKEFTNVDVYGLYVPSTDYLPRIREKLTEDPTQKNAPDNIHIVFDTDLSDDTHIGGMQMIIDRAGIYDSGARSTMSSYTTTKHTMRDRLRSVTRENRSKSTTRKLMMLFWQRPIMGSDKSS